MRHRQDEHDQVRTRRQVLRGAAGLGLAAATGTLLPACGNGAGGNAKATAQKADGPPETTSIRRYSLPDVQCIAAQYMAEPFLREEGFTDYTCDSLQEIRNKRIRQDFDPGDSVRFYALRLSRPESSKARPRRSQARHGLPIPERAQAS